MCTGIVQTSGLDHPSAGPVAAAQIPADHLLDDDFDDLEEAETPRKGLAGLE